MTKEETYDAEIAPLMTQIIAACLREHIDFAASFALDESAGDEAGPLMCSTVIIAEDRLPPSSQLLRKISKAIRESMGPPVMALTTLARQGDS